MIEATQLVKRFGALTAVDHLSIRVERGEVFGLLGPNGAGKSTAINMIVGVLRPDEGQVKIAGEADPTRPEVRRRLGIAPQALSIYEPMSAYENVRFFARLYGLQGRTLDERVMWAIEFVGLTDRRSDRASTFSGGMKRRLNLACGIVHDPEVILLDEPTVGVDPHSRNHIFDRVEELKARGRTIIYTTHYMEEAERLCDRVALIDHGRILDLGTVRELTERHGGRAIIRIETVEPPTADLAASFAGQVDGTMLTFATDDIVGDVSRTLPRLEGAGARVRSLRIDPPDLEAVFLELTGRQLRD